MVDSIPLPGGYGSSGRLAGRVRERAAPDSSPRRGGDSPVTSGSTEVSADVQLQVSPRAVGTLHGQRSPEQVRSLHATVHHHAEAHGHLAPRVDGRGTRDRLRRSIPFQHGDRRLAEPGAPRPCVVQQERVLDDDVQWDVAEIDRRDPGHHPARTGEPLRQRTPAHGRLGRLVGSCAAAADGQHRDRQDDDRHQRRRRRRRERAPRPSPVSPAGSTSPRHRQDPATGGVSVGGPTAP